MCTSVESRNLTLYTLFNGTWKSRIAPELTGQLTVKLACGNAGEGCPKKQMPECNAQDTGLNITRCENMPTSDWFSMARKFGESLINKGRQMTDFISGAPLTHLVDALVTANIYCQGYIYYVHNTCSRIKDNLVLGRLEPSAGKLARWVLGGP